MLENIIYLVIGLVVGLVVGFLVLSFCVFVSPPPCCSGIWAGNSIGIKCGVFGDSSFIKFWTFISKESFKLLLL